VRRNRGEAISRFFDDLSAGDPVALGLVAVVAVIGIGLGLFVLKVRRDLRREDEAKARKYGRSPS
jgi:hypothetical protein